MFVGQILELKGVYYRIYGHLFIYEHRRYRYSQEVKSNIICIMSVY